MEGCVLRKKAGSQRGNMKNLIQVLKKADAKSVVVIGDMMLDEYVIGSVDRISPEAPVPVFKEEKREFSFGGATNVAINCKHVGCHVDMIGLVGKHDQTGNRLLAMLAEKKIFVEGVIRTPDRVTTRKKRIVSQQQQLLRLDTEDSQELSDLERDRLICAIHTIIKPGSVVLISDYAKGAIDRLIVQEVIARANVCNSIIIVDPKGPLFDKYRGVDYLKPNLKEFYQIVDFLGLPRNRSILDNGRTICNELQLKGLIVTMGEDGMQFISGEDHSTGGLNPLVYPAHIS